MKMLNRADKFPIAKGFTVIPNGQNPNGSGGEIVYKNLNREEGELINEIKFPFKTNSMDKLLREIINSSSKLLPITIKK